MNSAQKGKRRLRKVDISYLIFRVIRETGWTVEELRKCPIPTFWLIVRELHKEDEANGSH